MIKQKFGTWFELDTLLVRAEKTFEKRSGWSPKSLRSAVANFRNLGPMDRVLFGGLLVGRALERKRTSNSPLRKRKTSKQRSEGSLVV